ncbi:MAG: hypothetical protein AB7E85_08590 [Pseudobdellovibrionaceae bacterium]
MSKLTGIQNKAASGRGTMSPGFGRAAGGRSGGWASPHPSGL